MREKEFQQVYESHRLIIFRYVLYKVRDPILAEDVTSDVFVKLFHELQKSDKVLSYIQAWLYKTAKNLIIDLARKDKRQSTRAFSEMTNTASEDENLDEPEFAAEIEHLLDQAITHEKLQRIKHGMEKLEKHEKEIIELRLIHELPFHDIGVILFISEAAAKMRFKRAVSELKKKVGDYDEKT